MNSANNDFSSLLNILESLKNRSVLVIGDIILDSFVNGEVHRISSESPVPVLSVKAEDQMLGGAGNVFSNLAGLETKARIFSIVGDDDDGRMLGQLVADKGGQAKDLIIVSDRKTVTKTRFMAAHQHLFCTDAGSENALNENAEDKLLSRIDEALPQAEALILSDYNRGVLTPRIVSEVIARASIHNVPVLVDPRQSDFSYYRGANVITPNRKELEDASQNSPTKTDEEITATGKAVLEQAGIEAMVATRSQYGMSVIKRAEDMPVHLRTEALEVFDVSGAGDTVIAVIAAALAAGADLVNASSLSNIAAGLVVAKIGTAPIHYQELYNEVQNKDLSSHISTANGQIIDTMRGARICEKEEALDTIKRWKARGMTVGFTNGCFDILHAGHVSYMTQARARCNRLVVGLNVDESIKRLKGASRPVNNEQARAQVLGALDAVDMVVFFARTQEEKDQAAIILSYLKPDIYFKGADYTLETLPEAPVVQAYGGKISFISFIEGHSTTNIIEKMKDDAA